MISAFHVRLGWGTFFAAILLLPMTARAADPPPPAENSPVWQKLRAVLFQDRFINESSFALVEVSAPERAEDPAVVPVSVRIRTVQTAEHYIKTLHLIVDNNPAPVVAVFHMTPDSGRADIETRVRVEQYTHVRAVVEMNDGALSMSAAYVKSSGGCSTPAGKDTSGSVTNLGKMKLAIEDNPKPHQPVMAQLMVRHPNLSGMVMDQITRLYERPHYLRKIEVAYAGRQVMTAELNFSISENPNFRFYFTPTADGVLTAEVHDTDELTFNASLNVKLH
jgi:sulfur-oxidizing protein SoxY